MTNIHVRITIGIISILLLTAWIITATVNASGLPDSMEFQDTEGKVTIELVEENLTVDIKIYDKDDVLVKEMRVLGDSVGRQLPSALQIIGINDKDKIAEHLEEALTWVAHKSGGDTLEYYISPGNTVVGVVQYSDRKIDAVLLRISLEGKPTADVSPRIHFHPEDVGEATTSIYVEADIDDHNFKRMTIARIFHPTYVFRWKSTE